MGTEKEIKVSVIIPVYNEETYLVQCLQSILEQSLKNIEIICVDDGSSDRSVELIEKFQKKDSRIRLIRQKNAGGGAARNRGALAARGEYLSFLDADDYFEPTMLEKMAEKLDETKSDLCICKVRCWHEDLNFYTEEYSAMREEFLPEKDVFSAKDMPGHIFNTFHNWPWNKMFRRSFVEEKGLVFQEILRTNDLFFTCTALVNAERITTVKEVLVNYRVGVAGTCQTTNQVAALDFFQAFKKLKEYLKVCCLYEEYKQSFINHALDGCIANLMSQETGAEQETLYHQLKGGLFRELDIENQEAEYFYNFNQRMYEFYRTIMEKDYATFLRKRVQDLKEERDTCLRLNHLEKMGIIERDDKRIRELLSERDMIRAELERTRAMLQDADRRVQEVYDSFSFRTGHLVTAPIRACGRAVRRKNRE
jgi:glycosyltransferase involved in cell wall biosynthesis